MSVQEKRGGRLVSKAPGSHQVMVLVQIVPPFHPVCVEAALMERIHPQTLSLTLMCLDWETNARELCVHCVFKHTAVFVSAVAEDDMRAGRCTSEDVKTQCKGLKKKNTGIPL